VHAELGPLVAGIARPRVVLPAALIESLDRDSLAAIVRHELAHVRRRDYLQLLLVQLATCLVWPVLPVWIAARRMRTLIEMACDEHALAGKGTQERLRYGELLIALAAGRPPVRGHASVPSFGWDLRGRLAALGLRRRWPLVPQVAAAAVLIGAGLAVAATRSDPEPVLGGKTDATTSDSRDVNAADSLETQPPHLTAEELSRRCGRPDPDNPKRELVDEPCRQTLLVEARKRWEARSLTASLEPLKDWIRRAGNCDPERSAEDRVELAVTVSINERGQAKAKISPRPPFRKDARLEACVLRELEVTRFPSGGRMQFGRRFSVPPQHPVRDLRRLRGSSELLPSSSVALGPVSVNGSLGKDAVARTVVRHLDEVKLCYHHELTTQPSLEGRVRMALVIDAEGRVSEASVLETTLGNPNAEGCMRKVASTWRFPKPPGSDTVTVTYPLTLTHEY
jgi:hypothetical protein